MFISFFCFCFRFFLRPFRDSVRGFLDKLNFLSFQGNLTLFSIIEYLDVGRVYILRFVLGGGRLRLV